MLKMDNNMDIISILKLELILRGLKDGSISWKTKDGKEIPVKDMSTQHIINVIKLSERKDREWEDNLDALSGFDVEKWG